MLKFFSPFCRNWGKSFRSSFKRQFYYLKEMLKLIVFFSFFWVFIKNKPSQISSKDNSPSLDLKYLLFYLHPSLTALSAINCLCTSPSLSIYLSVLERVFFNNKSFKTFILSHSGISNTKVKLLELRSTDKGRKSRGALHTELLTIRLPIR